MGYDDDKTVKANLEDYAKGQAWNDFVSTGDVEAYSKYSQIKEEFEEDKNLRKEDENSN